MRSRSTATTPFWSSFLMAALTLSSYGQPVASAPPCKANPDFHPAISPFEIEFGNEPITGKHSLKDLWSTLRIPSKLRFETSSGIRAGTEALECRVEDECEVKVVSDDRLLPQDGQDSIVRICDMSLRCRFLLLHQSAKGWSLIDYLDSPFEKYENPTAWVQAAQDRRWLVKSGFGGGGTGVYLAVNDWFEVRCGALKRVLTLPSRGHDVNAKPARLFSTRFKALHKAVNRESLEFGYVVLFEDYQNGHQLWQEERTVVFSRAKPEAGFVFDPVASNISAAFEKKVFSFDSMDEDEFVEFAYDRLRRIASDPADARRGWLRQYLASIPSTANVKSLKAILAAQNVPQHRKPTP
jgi:hypothetical protein